MYSSLRSYITHSLYLRKTSEEIDAIKNSSDTDDLLHMVIYGSDEHRDWVLANRIDIPKLCYGVAVYGNYHHCEKLKNHPMNLVASTALSMQDSNKREFGVCDKWD